jgi:xanthine dehydrogenase large subunit
MKNKDSYGHLRGESIFVDDINIQQNTLFGLVFDSPKAHGKILSVDYTEALALNGVETILTAGDITGENQIGGIIPDEPLFATDEVHFMGQPIALILATSERIAKQARKLIKLKIATLPVITGAKEAFDKNSFVCSPRTFNLGKTQDAFESCTYIYQDEVFSNGQEHLYLETQGAYAIPMENGQLKIHSSTQGPTSVQKIAAQVLGIPMHKIEIDVNRLGGGFGGKEDQATPWAVMAALGAFLLKTPVKLILNRHDDLRMTGKRHPYESTFKIGLDKDYKIQAFEVAFYQNSGAAADLSPAIAERTLFHATNSYFIPNVKTTVYNCKTNLPPNTAFRGFGGPQGMFVIESAINKAAEALGIDAAIIQKKNLFQENDTFSYGQIAKQVLAEKTWNTLAEKFDLEKTQEEVNAFNKRNKTHKKGLALMPICFGISFTNTPMNHARALIHIYQDGSVGVSTGAVEMGQSVNTKMLKIAADAFGISLNKVKIETTNTTRVANTSPTAASATADLNGKAVLVATAALNKRLKEVAADLLKTSVENIFFEDNNIYQNNKKTVITWEALIAEAMLRRVALTENGHYATPEIHFDKSKEKGHPFAYHVYGNALTVVDVDCIRGIYEVEEVNIIHDFGKSMTLGIDIGQVEGALVQGIGWMTLEEIGFDKNGRLQSNALSTYKVPDIFSAPKSIRVLPLETEGHDLAILKSKAVGEPPLMYGIGTYFAIQNAIKAFNPNYKKVFHSPYTPEKVLMDLYRKQ